ncbi:MAG: hypothetical protein AVDCRST_MAG66-267, partial [uncultured Pseudonocardia sp.]
EDNAQRRRPDDPTRPGAGRRARRLHRGGARDGWCLHAEHRVRGERAGHDGGPRTDPHDGRRGRPGGRRGGGRGGRAAGLPRRGRGRRLRAGLHADDRRERHGPGRRRAGGGGSGPQLPGGARRGDRAARGGAGRDRGGQLDRRRRRHRGGALRHDPLDVHPAGRAPHRRAVDAERRRAVASGRPGM